MKICLITGSSGLIGSESVSFFADKFDKIIGIDNNMRERFFGADASTEWNTKRLLETTPNFEHYAVDIRDMEAVEKIFATYQNDIQLIVHTAAQPSHDWAANDPIMDFTVNANGTLNLLEATRKHCPKAVFIFTSTNKVYGDAPNLIEMVELDKRFDYSDQFYKNGIAETFSIDQTKHSLFGASKVSADISVQEYGRYFNMPTACLRGGCLTGPNHSGVELHGFLSYLIKCNLEEKEYTIFGYKGKQVRDNIHSYDVARFIEEFIAAPRIAEVYNIGGGKENSCSILEAFDLIASLSGKAMKYKYSNENRIGDHICYYSDLRKMKAHYPNWDITKTLQQTFEEIYESWLERSK